MAVLRRIFAALVALVALVGAGATHSSADVSTRVINGSTATSGTYTFIASVMVDSPDGMRTSGCGGSLINAEWVLTAAHCFLNEAGNFVDPTSATRTTVTLASDTLDPVSSNAEVFSVAKLIVHPGYNPDQENSTNPYDNDIALLKLRGKSSQAAVKLQAAKDTVADGSQAIIMGWGTTAVDANNTSLNSSNTLLEAAQIIVGNADCSKAYGSTITHNMICAGGLYPDLTIQHFHSAADSRHAICQSGWLRACKRLCGNSNRRCLA